MGAGLGGDCCGGIVRRGAAAEARQGDAAQTLRQGDHHQQDDQALHQQLALGDDLRHLAQRRVGQRAQDGRRAAW